MSLTSVDYFIHFLHNLFESNLKLGEKATNQENTVETRWSEGGFRIVVGKLSQ